jgi:O-antigen ligase
LIFILFQNIRKGFILTIIGLVITIPFIGDLFNLLSDTFINIRGDELNDSSTIEYRFYRWNYLFNFINENYNDFIFGTGINNFNKFINSEYKFSIDHAISGSTLHNFFLDVLLSTGLLGIVFILKYFFIVVRKLIKTDYSINSQFYCVVFSIIVILMLMDISWEHIYILPLTIIFMTNSKYLNLSTNLK